MGQIMNAMVAALGTRTTALVTSLQLESVRKSLPGWLLKLAKLAKPELPEDWDAGAEKMSPPKSLSRSNFLS